MAFLSMARRASSPKQTGTTPRAARPTNQAGSEPCSPSAITGEGAYIRFRETNPIYFRSVFDTSTMVTVTCVGCRRVCNWVRFRKRTHFGGVFGVVFIERRVRFMENEAMGVAAVTVPHVHGDWDEWLGRPSLSFLLCGVILPL